MKILNKTQLETLMEDYTDGGIVFCEYMPDIMTSQLHVTDGDHGATDVIPWHGEVFDWDWSINEYSEKDLFMVFDNNDVLQMIQTLVRGLKIEDSLEDDYA